MGKTATPARSEIAGGDEGLVRYFVGAYALSWVFWIPAVLADTGQLTLSLPSFAFQALGGLGPMLAAILVCALESGMAGVRGLFGQLKRWRVRPRWYVMTLVGVPALGLAAAGIHATLGGTLATETIPEILIVLPFQFVFVALIGGGLDEEMGWRGFALPRLQARYDPTIANFVLGVLWTCWHLPLFFIGGSGFIYAGTLRAVPTRNYGHFVRVRVDLQQYGWQSPVRCPRTYRTKSPPVLSRTWSSARFSERSRHSSTNSLSPRFGCLLQSQLSPRPEGLSTPSVCNPPDQRRQDNTA